MNYKKLLKFYITGFVLSIILTLGAYFPVAFHMIPRETLILYILALAFIQLLVQLFFFLHMGEESKPRWKLVIFISFIGIILIVITGSLWIMQHLNYNMSLIQMSNVMQNGEGF